MTIRTRLVLLLVCLTVAFGFSVIVFQQSHHAEAEGMLASLRQERSALLDRLLELSGGSLASFASEYSLWDEMVAFVESSDRNWAGINIDPSLANFDADGAWVAKVDGTILYASLRGENLPLTPPPFDHPDFLERLRRNHDLHYFQETPAGLIEVRTGAILPSDDIRRERAPRGWFIVARLWNESHLLKLADILQGHVTLAPPGVTAPLRPPTMIHLQRTLPGWDGRLARILQVEYESPSLALLLAGNEEEIYLFFAFGAILILVVMFTLTFWVMRPLRHLSRSLESGDAGAIRDLQRHRDEFGHLARQAAQSFLQRDALRDSEARLRQWMTLHDRLARDMHDGIIQSIYAAGLGVESARNLLKSDPAAADQRLQSCQRMFNDALWQVRTFIHDLEPELPSGQTPAQSLATLVSNMQNLQPIPILAEIDPAIADHVTPQQDIHLLHMAREILSNALRHSGAAQVKVSLRAESNNAVLLEITDDGCGFDPAAESTSGRGLSNLAARAREIGARLEIDSTPRKGTRISLWFRPITSPSPT